MKMKTLAVAAAAFAVSAPVLAAAPSLSDVLGASGLSVSGRVEAGYDYANTDKAGGAKNADFASYNRGDEFVLHQAAINVAKTPASGIGGAVTVIAGEDAKVLNTGGNQFHLLQGYLSYATGNWTVIGGRFLTLAGAEVIDSSANFNSSRGILFGFQPSYHNGLRATYKVSDALSLTGGIMNSVAPADAETNTDKTFEANAVYMMGALTNSLTVYYGQEGSPGRYNTLIDYVGTYMLSPATTLALNVDYFNNQLATSGHSEAYGLAAYVNQKLDSANRLAARFEYGHADGKGIFGSPTNVDVKEITLTAGHALTSSFEVALEGRYNFANATVFANRAGKKDETIASVRAVYKF